MKHLVLALILCAASFPAQQAALNFATQQKRSRVLTVSQEQTQVCKETWTCMVGMPCFHQETCPITPAWNVYYWAEECQPLNN